MGHPRLTSRQIFEEHAGYVFRVLRYFGVREADLPDVCQEVFVTAHRKLDTFEGRSSVRTWLYRICQRAASDARRRAHVRHEVVTDLSCEENLRGQVADAPAQIEARSMLVFLLDRLDQEKRDVFVMYEIEGLTMREVCEIVECPLQTAYSRLHAARALVVKALADERDGSST